VADDALLDGTLAGLMDLGLCPGRDIEVIAHANFPIAETLPWPIARVGFDIAATLDTFLDLLGRQRRGESGVPMVTTIPVTVQAANPARPDTASQSNLPTLRSMSAAKRLQRQELHTKETDR